MALTSESSHEPSFDALQLKSWFQRESGRPLKWTAVGMLKPGLYGILCSASEDVFENFGTKSHRMRRRVYLVLVLFSSIGLLIAFSARNPLRHERP